MKNKEKRDKISALRKEMMSCKRCPLYKNNKNYVFGDGDINSPILLVGESPGAEEAIQGKPFVGRSGKLLDEMLGSIGFKRDDVFISNVIHCRPPENRDPQEDEISSCGSFLKRQIEIISPMVIITLGRFALHYFFPSLAIGGVHGKILVSKRTGRKFLVLYHPAAGIYDINKKPVLFNDIKSGWNTINNMNKD